mgnify:CR=1 FL=1
MDDFRKITIVGMGLIGGSLALALKKIGYTGQVTGSDRDDDILNQALQMQAVDVATSNAEEAVLDADLVIIAVSVGQYMEVFKEIGPFLKEGAIVTDVGSVKNYAIEIATRYLPQYVEFLGGHPMAGSEKDGFRAASPYLYENAYYFLTPMAQNTDSTIIKLKSFIRSLGAYPICTNALEHDRIVARISHMPHLSAVLLVNLLGQGKSDHYLSFAGGGFRDTTRIASGNPKLWKDIILLNKKEIIQEIQLMQEMFGKFKNFLEENKEQDVFDMLKNAKKVRDQIPVRLKDGLPPIYETIVVAGDRPGILAELTKIIGDSGINIKEIEILHSREYEKGAIRFGFECEEDEKNVVLLLKKAGYRVSNKSR